MRLEDPQLSDTMHKFSLFAYDVLFTLRDPEYSFKLLYTILKHFGKISGYKVNEIKSAFMGVNIEIGMKEQLKGWTAILWKNKIRYLGINLEMLVGLGNEIYPH